VTVTDLPRACRRRVAIDRILPDVDGGRFAAKRIVNQPVVIEADIVCDGHDELECQLLVRFAGGPDWTAIPMTCEGNDRWRASFTPGRLGRWEVTVRGRVDLYATWRRDLARREQAGEELAAELAEGRRLVEGVASVAPAAVAKELVEWAAAFGGSAWRDAVDSQRLRQLLISHADRRDETVLEPPRTIWVDRERAAWGAWYEVFPRSWGMPGTHGTLADLADRLDYIAGMGFDVLYLAPIHPIGTAFRKGRNNSLVAQAEDVGSPWGVGSAAGGHTAIHPELGTLADFEDLRQQAARHGLELALDLALQCSPDHPWVREHPEWFRHRADGTIRYAENPPKKYQDIYPLDFDCEAWRALWLAILDVVLCWVDRGVRIFRVDNPHTKPFAFWEWLIDKVHAAHPDVLFLAEAFTRPKTMYRLAKLGFTQSYTYFTWRTDKEETAAYLREVTSPPVSDFFRPNFFTNTPDILHASLQEGGRPMFQVRLALAALSVGNWGIYGPAMELLSATPREPGSEEYLDSEKYEIKAWRLDDPASLAPFITRLNRIRRDEAALVANQPPLLQPVNDEHLLAWCRYDPASGSRVLVVVNLAPAEPREGGLQLDLAALDMEGSVHCEATDLLWEPEGGPEIWRVTDLRLRCTPERPVLVFRFRCLPDTAALA
jgi:starch synthase (maltosyl-transferring)